MAKKKLLKKQTFINAINSIEELHKMNIQFAENMQKCFPNSNSAHFIIDTDFVTKALIQVLQELFQDNYTHSWIEYFCWELDFGSLNWRLKVTDNGEDIPLSTPDQLFDFLTR